MVHNLASFQAFNLGNFYLNFIFIFLVIRYWCLYACLKKNMLIHVSCFPELLCPFVHWNWYWWLIFSSLLQVLVTLSTHMLTLIFCFASSLLWFKSNILNNDKHKPVPYKKLAERKELLFYSKFKEILYLPL